MTPNFTTAKDVSENLLDRTGKALMSGDFDLFASCFVLPHVIETFQGRRTVETVDDLKKVFDGVTAYFRQKNVTELARHCVEAEFRDDDTIVATHMSRVVSGARLVQKPYPVLSVLRKIGENWIISDSMYAIEDQPAHAKALSG